MSISDKSRRRCLKAIGGILEFLERDKYNPDQLRRLEGRFLSPSGIVEANVHELRKEGLAESDAQLMALIPSLTRYCLRMNYGEHPKLAALPEYVPSAGALAVPAASAARAVRALAAAPAKPRAAAVAPAACTNERRERFMVLSVMAIPLRLYCAAGYPSRTSGPATLHEEQHNAPASWP